MDLHTEKDHCLKANGGPVVMLRTRFALIVVRAFSMCFEGFEGLSLLPLAVQLVILNLCPVIYNNL